MNKKGHAQNLVSAHPGNTNATRHGVYSERVIETRTAEIKEQLFSSFWFTVDQRIAAHEVARCLAILEAIDRDLDERGLVDKKGHARSLLEHRVRISRRLEAWLTKISTTIDRQTVREYERRMFSHEDYVLELKRIALGDDPRTTSHERMAALKTLELIQLVWAEQWLEDYLKTHPEKRAEYVMEHFQA